MKKIVLSILIVALLNGCNAFPKGTISQPEGKVILNEKQYTMIPVDYEWEDENVKITDISSRDINELADDFETLEVKKGDILNFEIEKNPSSIIITKLDEEGLIDNVEIKDYKITMPSKEGYYIYELKVVWDKGKETFVFDVDVK
ncbi:hypothetical protein FC756_14275 [Lysinibacillus mangiferihumi]|uniref:Lipoprotein n=1 Tax=Lysinibacillus mangiferihumi TaxID=1130819 RepID=A0A4U2YZU3_9BACI|nr:hypothetical protein [Lysinibacillus mangiferihumi]TKI66894.1 hypothetical protein FC756_14275 [Lysinibacillus mangiferihumi]